MAEKQTKEQKQMAEDLAADPAYAPPDVVDHAQWDKLEPPKGEPDYRPGNRGVPSKALLEEHPQTHPGALSPGQYAEEVAGPAPDVDPDSDEAREHADKHNAAKRRRRFGY